jgi:hypothetical protein
MLTDGTRSRVIQAWFVAIALVAAAAVAFGPAVTLGTAVMVFAASLVPPAIVFALWPKVQPVTETTEPTINCSESSSTTVSNGQRA